MSYLFNLFFSDPATTEIDTLSLHDALPSCAPKPNPYTQPRYSSSQRSLTCRCGPGTGRSEEHTSELQSHVNLVCRLLLEKKKISSLLVPMLRLLQYGV